MNALVDRLYRVPTAVRRFEAEHPDDLPPPGEEAAGGLGFSAVSALLRAVAVCPLVFVIVRWLTT